MAKQAKTKPVGKSPSLADFSEENFLNDEPVDLTASEEQEEEEEEEQEEEEEEEIVPVKKPTKVAKKGKPEPKTDEPEPEPEPEPTEEEEQEEGEEGEEEGEDESKLFFEKVSSITGVEFEVDYADVDPLSPQGIALRDKALIEKTVTDFVNKLAEEHPQVYQALEYANAGGNIQDLFTSEKDYSKITIAEDNEEHAKQILTEYYQSRGITNEARIKRMIAAEMESEEGIIEVARGALAELAQEQAEEQAAKVAQQQEQLQAQRQADSKFLGSVNELLKSGQLSGFKIPSQAEATQFFDFLKKSIQRDGKGGYLIVTPVDAAQLEKQLQTEYFRFKKGDLNKLIQVKAGTMQANKLRLKLEGGEKKTGSTVKEDRQKIASLKDYEV